MAKVLATQRAMNSRPAALTMAALLNGRAITIPKLYSTMGLAQLKTSVGNVAETALAARLSPSRPEPLVNLAGLRANWA